MPSAAVSPITLAVALAYQRLAGDSRRAMALQERTTNLEVLDGLLATLTGVLDVREVFDRVSAIAQKVLPHDAMSISELIEQRREGQDSRQSRAGSAARAV